MPIRKSLTLEESKKKLKAKADPARAKRKKEGQEFIQAREKKLAGTDNQTRQQVEAATRAVTAEQAGQKAISDAADLEAQKQEQIPAPIPEAAPLDPAVTSVEGLAVGPERAGFQKILDTPFGRATTGKVALEELDKQGKAEGYVAMTKYMLETGATPKSLTDDPTAQFILSLKLNEKDLELLKSGNADVDDLAILMEGLPLKALGVGKFVTTIPSERIDALAMKIEKVGNTVRDYRMAAARTPANKDVYATLIDKSESKIRDAESRIKLIIIQSPHYQNAPEEVEVIQENTNRALNRIGDARNAIQQGETIEQAMLAGSLE